MPFIGDIVLNETPADWRVPGSYVEIRPNYQRSGLAGYSPRALLVGQMLTGLAAAGSLQRINRRDQARALFGAGSSICEMIEAFLDQNPTTDLYAIGLGAPSGSPVAASGTITFSGTATAVGTIALYAAGQRIAVSVPVGMTAAQAAAALEAALDAAIGLPVTADVSGAVVTVTARHAGLIGNGIDLRLNYQQGEVLPAGLTATIVGMANGTLAPAVGAALATVASEPFTDIAIAWTDSTSLAALATELARRYVAGVALDAHAYVGMRGALSDLLTAGNAQNSPHLSLIGAKASPTSPWVWAAALAGKAAFHLANDPARQLRGIQLVGVLPPAPADRFTPDDQDDLLRDGISTFEVRQDGSVVLQRVISAYQVSGLGVPDTAWLDIMIAKTLSRIRYDWRAYLALNYPRHKLADEGSPAAEYGSDVVTPRLMHSVWATRCKVYERLGWIEDVARTVAESTFVRDGTDKNRLNAVQRVRIIGALMVFASALEFEA